MAELFRCARPETELASGGFRANGSFRSGRRNAATRLLQGAASAITKIVLVGSGTMGLCCISAKADWVICRANDQNVCTVTSSFCGVGSVSIGGGYPDKWSACRAVTDGLNPELKDACFNGLRGCSSPLRKTKRSRHAS
jgi:hypothetical protein